MPPINRPLRHLPIHRLLALALPLTLPWTLQADFSIHAAPETVPPESQWELVRHDVDARSDRRVAIFEAATDGSLSASIDQAPGVFKLKGPSDIELWLAADADDTLELVPDQHADGFRIIGSEATSKLQAYHEFRQRSLERLVYPPRQAANQAKAAGASPQRLAELAEKEVEATTAHLKELNDYVIDQVGASLALYGTSLRWDGDRRLQELETLVDELEENHGSSDLTRSMRQRIEASKRVAIGSAAPELVAQTPDGESRALSDLRGKVVLVDFWASWCVPCRTENAHYVTLKQRWPSDQFEIFAVNLDDSRVDWLKAVQRDGADGWVQVSDSQGWHSPLAAAYKVTSLPASFLLDPEGRIIAKNLRGPKLAAAIRSALTR